MAVFLPSLCIRCGRNRPLNLAAVRRAPDTDCVVWLFQGFLCLETWGRDPCSPGPAPRGSSLFSPERPRGNCCQDGVTFPSPSAGEPSTQGSARCVSQGIPAHGTEPFPSRRRLRFTRCPHPRRGNPVPRTESRRWRLDPGRHPGLPCPKVSPAERPSRFAFLTLRLERHQAPAVSTRLRRSC